MSNTALTVSQLTNSIKYLLEGQKTFQGFLLKGEISNFTAHRTGHLYFSLKDENAQIRAIMFSSHANSLNFKPKEGDKVTVKGSISLYAPQGSYSVQVVQMDLDGAGELYLKYLKLKEDLKKLGWFDKAKKPIPKFPKRIGVVTSATGAVIEDITNTVNRRYRLTEIILYPALVQGPGASESISKQIQRANDENLVDVLIVGRGGGSIEDLWGFNELSTISAIYNSKLPIITAIGHETDDTLSDLVSDLRAPTPTAAAEIATPNTIDLVNQLSESESIMNYRLNSLIRTHQNTMMHLSERLETSGPIKKLNNYGEAIEIQNRLLNNYYTFILKNKFNNLKELMVALKGLSPYDKIANNKQKIENYELMLNRNYELKLNQQKDLIVQFNKNLKTNINYVYTNKTHLYTKNISDLEKVNPLAIMKRGFAMVKDDNNNIITSVKKLDLGSKIEVNFEDGFATANIIDKKEK